MKGGILRDVEVRQSTSPVQLFFTKDQTLLVRGNAFLIRDLGLHNLDRVGGLDIKIYSLASEGLHEDVHDSVLKHKSLLVLQTCMYNIF